VLAAWGLVRPQILVPAGSEEWSSGCVRVVLLHELAHIRRHDWIVQVLAGVLRAVYWFDPLIWIASSRLRHESERACDDLVVSHDIDAHEYAGHLLALARVLNRGVATWTPAPSMAGPSSLRQRIAAILDPAATHARARRSAVASVAVLLLLVTAPVAAFRLSAPVKARATDTTSSPPAVRLDTNPSTVVTTRVDVGTTTSAPAAIATPRAPSPIAPDLSPVDPSPKTTAIAVLDLIQSTPLSDPTSMLSAHTFLRSNVDTLQRAARAVIDDDGNDPSSGRAKSRALLDAITNAASAATSIANRANTSPETRSALTALAASLRSQAADLRAIIPPIAMPAVGAGASPARQTAVAALSAVQTARGDDPLWEHAFLATQLETVERAAEAVLDDDGTSERAATARQTALSNTLLAAANAASNIGGRANETEHIQSATVDLAATLRGLAGQLINAVQTAFVIHLPPDVEPEHVSIFYSLALSGRMPDSVTTKPDVFDYMIDTKASHDLKLLIVVPGYRVVTAQFTDAEMRSVQPYTPRLIPSSTTLRGRLVDSSRRPIRNFGLTLSYELGAAVDYFCGNCTLDGSIPTVPIDSTRTNDVGEFSFTMLNVTEDPFFQRRSTAVGAFYVSSTARGEHSWLFWGDDTLRPSRIDASSTAATPLVITHVDHGILSGRLGKDFLKEHGLVDDLSAYAFDLTEVSATSPKRQCIQLDATWKNGDTSGGYNAMLKPDGSFEVSVPPRTYDLKLSILDRASGTLQQTISVSTRVVVREDQRTVVDRP
jgi:hypothetical protein